MRTKPDPAAENAFIEENLERNDWQGTASVNLALMAFDLGVLWPVNREAGRVAALVDDALVALKRCKEADATSSDAFAAGTAVGLVAETLRSLQVRRLGTKARKRNKKTDTDAFYAVADRLVAGGSDVGTAYLTARERLKNHSQRFKLRDFTIPSLAVFTTHLSRRRARGI